MRLIIDTDAGVDDSQAIMMALKHPNAVVEAITTVTGNIHVDKVVPNIFTILEIMQAGNIPVYRGAETPLVPGNWHPETAIHGEDGLGNYHKRPPTRRQIEPIHAAIALVNMVNAAPGEYTIVALGPLTNLALACRLDPDFAQKVRKLVFMGGTISAIGNTPNLSAEYNIYCDPEAAAVVLTDFSEASMVSWETTLQHPFLWEQYEALVYLNTQRAEFFRETTLTTAEYLRGVGAVPGYLLPDPLAMAAALEPDIVQDSSFQYVTIELTGSRTRGQTVIDHFGLTGQAPNVHIVRALDTTRVYELYQYMLS